VRVRVSNSKPVGAPPIEDVRVDAYVMDPFVGVANPLFALHKLTGFAAAIESGTGGPSAIDPHVVVCKIQDPIQGAIPWTPTAAELATTHNGHLCLIANAYSDGDGAPVPDAGTFDVLGNPHQGQRNIALLAAADPAPFKFTVMPHPEGIPTAIDIHQLTAKVALQGGERWLLRSRANIGTIGGRGPLALTVRPGQPHVPLTFSRRAVNGKVEIDGFGEADLRSLAAAAKRITRQPGGFAAQAETGEWGAGRLVFDVPSEGVQGTLTLQRNDTVGSLQFLDLVQRDSSGRALGGLRVISLQR
jgi:hypothetical protein